MTEFVVFDVFTDKPFGGNPLAVIPDASRLPEADLQRIAREFNFSETTFVYSPQDHGNRARVRIFTPNQEINFAGHPTIGTAVALGQDGTFVLELGVGPITCTVSGQDASFTVAADLEIIAEPSVGLAAEVLGLKESDIVTTTHAPLQISVGLPFVVVEIADKDTLSRASCNLDAMRRAATLHPAGMDFATFVYCRDGDRVDARMFAPLDNIPEDPATGSASAALAALLADRLGTPVNLSIHQGDDMGRPSRIAAQTLTGKPTPVKISGRAIETMRGTLTY